MEQLLRGGSRRAGRRGLASLAILPLATSLLITVPMLAVPLLAQAAEAAGPTGTLSCRQRIAAVLETILRRNLASDSSPPLNAFQTLNPSALAQAEALDRAVAAGAPPGPLHCLPLAAKDNLASFDLPMAVGSLALLGNQPDRDALILARLRAAGAILVGKTAMDEFAFGIRGFSGAAGRVGNALNPWMSAGGSSSGSGVAVGAGFVPLALGSDNCGSLRLPAVYNGAVSLRPTQNRISSDGLFPIGVLNGTPGLIAQDLPGLEQGLAVIAPDWRRSAARRPAALAGRRLGVLRRAGPADLQPTTAEARQLLEQGLALLRAAGAEVVESVELEAFDPRLGPGLLRGAAPLIDALLASYPASRRNWADVCSSGRIPPEWSPRECLDLFRVDPPEQARAQKLIAANRRHLETVLRQRRLDALVLLPDRRGGARADASDQITCFVSSNAAVPAVVLPIGLDQRGMPVGLELLAAADHDEELVAMATALEAQRGPLPLRPRLLDSLDPQPMRALGADSQGLGRLSIPAHNSLVSALGWRAWRSRRGAGLHRGLAPDRESGLGAGRAPGLGDLEPARFRRLTQRLLRSWTAPADAPADPPGPAAGDGGTARGRHAGPPGPCDPCPPQVPPSTASTSTCTRPGCWARSAVPSTTTRTR